MRAGGTAITAETTALRRPGTRNADPFTNVVRVTVMTLRRRLGDPPRRASLLPGAGYRIA